MSEESKESSNARGFEIAESEIEKVNTAPFASGAYADVYLWKWHGLKVAVKQLRVNPQSDQMKALKREMILGVNLSHSNVVRLFGSVQFNQGHLGIVMEWAEQGSLREGMKSFNPKQKINNSKCICEGLIYLHSKKIVHRDLKPENILLFGQDPTAKISDFGISKVIQTMMTNTSMAGTPKYNAPELLEPGQKYDFGADIYSLSIVFYELFSGLDPFPGCESVMQILKASLMDQRPEFPRDFPVKLKDLISRGWSKVPSERTPVNDFLTELNNMNISLSNGRSGDHAAAVRRSKSSASKTKAEVVPTSLVNIQLEAQQVLEDSIAYHKFVQDITEAIDWLKAKLNVLAKSELGKSLEEVQFMMKQLEALKGEIAAHEISNKLLQNRGLTIARKNRQHEKHIQVLSNQMVSSQEELKEMFEIRNQNLIDSLELQNFHIQCREMRKWIAEKEVFVSQKIRYHDGFLEKLSNQINVLETEMPNQRVKIQKLERQSIVLLENCLFDQAEVQKQIRDLTTAFSEFEREMLQQKSKLLRFQERIKSHRVKAQQINQMIQAHITAASATETGKTQPATEKLINEFNLFKKDVLKKDKEKRIQFEETVKDFKNDVIKNKTEDFEMIAEIDNCLNQVDKTWKTLENLIHMRGIALTSSRDFHIFSTTTTQVLNWISGQEKVLQQKFELKDTRAIEVSTQMMIQMTKTLDEKISQVEAITDKSEYLKSCPISVQEIEEQLSKAVKTLRQNIEARNCEIRENENLIEHNKNYDELTAWVTKLPQEMLKFEIGTDLAEMETLSSNHAVYGAEIRNWLETNFASFITTGKALMQCTYLDTAAIYEKSQILTRRSKIVTECWKLRNSIYTQHLKYLQWIQDVTTFETWMKQANEDKLELDTLDDLDQLVSQLLEQILPNKDLEGNILKCTSLLNPDLEGEENLQVEPEKSKVNLARRNSEEIRARAHQNLRHSKSSTLAASSFSAIDGYSIYNFTLDDNDSNEPGKLKRAKSLYPISLDASDQPSGFHNQGQQIEQNIDRTVILEDNFYRKQLQSLGKSSKSRSWKHYLTVLNNQRLIFYKSEDDRKHQKEAGQSINLKRASIQKAADYTKKDFVIRIMTPSPDLSEYLLDVGSQAKFELWFRTLQTRAAM